MHTFFLASSNRKRISCVRTRNLLFSFLVLTRYWYVKCVLGTETDIIVNIVGAPTILTWQSQRGTCGQEDAWTLLGSQGGSLKGLPLSLRSDSGRCRNSHCLPRATSGDPSQHAFTPGPKAVGTRPPAPGTWSAPSPPGARPTPRTLPVANAASCTYATVHDTCCL